MAIGDLPIFMMMKQRMQWLSERQAVLSQNVASPVAGGLGMKLGQARGGEMMKKPDFETTPTGNSVVLEDQMVKVAETQMDYQTVTSLYAKSMGLFKIALGRG